MSEAPEEKWLAHNGGLPSGNYPQSEMVRYVRADVHEAAVAAARKEGMVALVVSSINDLVAWLESDADNIHFLPADDVRALREWMK